MAPHTCRAAKPLSPPRTFISHPAALADEPGQTQPCECHRCRDGLGGKGAQRCANPGGGAGEGKRELGSDGPGKRSGAGPSAGGRKQEGSGQGPRCPGRGCGVRGSPGRWGTIVGLCWRWLGMRNVPARGWGPPARCAPAAAAVQPQRCPRPSPCRILGCLAPKGN